MAKPRNRPIDLRPAGPGSVVDEGIAPRPTLEGATEYEWVEIHNPLPVDFVAQIGVTRPTKAPISMHTSTDRGLTHDESDLRRNYGLDLRNPDHSGKANIVNRVAIKTGQTIRVLGNEAQVIVRQLVREILQRQDKRLMLADPYQQHLIEQQIIVNRGNVSDFMAGGPVTVQQQLQSALQEKNRESEPEFPDAPGSVESIDDRDPNHGGETQSGAVGTDRGRPKKASA